MVNFTEYMVPAGFGVAFLLTVVCLVLQIKTKQKLQALEKFEKGHSRLAPEEYDDTVRETTARELEKLRRNPKYIQLMREQVEKQQSSRISEQQRYSDIYQRSGR